MPQSQAVKQVPSNSRAVHFFSECTSRICVSTSVGEAPQAGQVVFIYNLRSIIRLDVCLLEPVIPKEMVVLRRPVSINTKSRLYCMLGCSKEVAAIEYI